MTVRSLLCRSAMMAVSALTLAAVPSVASASSPTSSYVVPSKLEFFPDEAKATSVVIHGGFFFYQTGGSYGTPACGYMYFQCPAGSETMCRMQWTDIKNAIGMPQCMGFGQLNTTSKATLRKEGVTPTSPDTWDLGIGVSTGSFVGGQCAPAQALKCPLPAPPDMALPTPDMTSVPAADMTVSGPSGGGSGSSSGCAVTGADGALSGLALLSAASCLALLRRRKR